MYSWRETWFTKNDIGQWKDYVRRKREVISDTIINKIRGTETLSDAKSMEGLLRVELNRELRLLEHEVVDNGKDINHELVQSYIKDLTRTLERIRDVRRPTGADYFVLLNQEKPVAGMAIAYQDEEIWGRTRYDAFLKNFVSVEPGAGSFLLRYVEHKLAFLGIENLKLDYWGENKKLGKYYENIGFEPMGTAGTYGEAGGTIAKMQKKLTSHGVFRSSRIDDDISF